ncbi:hypothetical protein Tel_14835 [Candidatus Tenderia electrophaga]|uniref:Two-component system response regulator n=1 Tax=Candidatus Tenderia electrophaga TaxID=1748243 RepID=A0A0S2TGL8_9GAMM|nr:hypothetical protein Tel_14835 [Candidatus Tenderia electrophaga]
MKILIAEDEVHIARAVMTILKKSLSGCNTDHAKNGEEAVRMAAANDYDLIISDWNMPKKNGDQVLRELKENERTMNVPFVMLTARGDRDSVMEALKDGANEYVVKPFKTPEFIAKIQGVLNSTSPDKRRSAVDNSKEVSLVDLIVDKFKKGEVALPVLPGVVTRVNTLFESEEVDVEALAKVIESDAAIAAKLITVANSPLVRGSSKCVSVEQAITRLGLQQTKNYVFAAANKADFVADNKLLKGVVEDLWEHSLATAYCAKALAQELKCTDIDTLFIMGLLHDIGKLLLISIIQELAKVREGFDEDAVLDILTKLHCEFGAALLKSWHYDAGFQDVARYHHAAFNSEQVSCELLIVYLANLMVREIGLGGDGAGFGEALDSEAARKLNVSAECAATVLMHTEQSLAAAKQAL